MNNRQKDESWRERCVRLIAIEPDDIGFRIVSDPDDATTLFDLLDMGYVRGSEMMNEVGNIIEFRTMGATLAGRLFAEEQQTILEAASAWGRTKKILAVFGGWLMGIFTAFVVYQITKNG